jgi:DNA-binding GntR family transcriptional regulator
MRFETKEERIADFLREQIISGRLSRGTRLKQAEVAAQLNTSITPVREAFRILKAEHYLSGESHLGMVVTPFDADSTGEIRDLRVLLEGQLIVESVKNLREADVTDLKALARAFAEAIDDPDSSVARGLNYRFHHRLYEVARLPQTLQFVQMLWARYPFDLINKIPDRVSHAVEEHAKLLACLASGDAVGAVTANQRHIDKGWEELRVFLDQTDS